LDERNWAIPAQVVSLEEIQTAIKRAEDGPFMTVQEAMNDFEQWLKSFGRPGHGRRQ
jgi:hypothetical protein